MNKAKWIWLMGDYELYHSIKLHSRREEFGAEYPCFWSLSVPYPVVTFSKTFSSDKEGFFNIKSHGTGYIEIDGKRLSINDKVEFGVGTHTANIRVICDTYSFPCIYINSEFLCTDETWTCNHNTTEQFPVGAYPEYPNEDDDPREFKFSYKKIMPVSDREISGGRVFDFGKETFALLCISGADKTCEYEVFFGESEEEATDTQYTLVRKKISGNSKYRMRGRAFRYVYIKGENTDSLKVSADYEYLPLTDRASFFCDNEKIHNIWQICAYTFHLNSREFFLDGIKRDRWVWSGDAYQSYMANNYLYFDPEITKRTIIALLGKPPYEQHINTINDYSMYLIIGTYEYYASTGDVDFIRFVWKRIRALYDFISSRADENDYICQREGDWIFIDWSDMDKSGNLCAEQILYWKTKLSMSQLAYALGEDGKPYETSAASLKRRIMKDYWRKDKGAFIDCYSSGLEKVTRHANIFAIIYDFVSKKNAQSIVKNVLDNESITHITTPYFEFFELMAYGKTGNLKHIQDKIESYWGGIVDLGGTSIWEQYIPQRQGSEHYEMYGMKYGCSLCHAWGSGPIYLLGRFCLGVYPTGIGYKTFTVEPKPGKYKEFSGVVPLPCGEVSVKLRNGKLTVKAGADGGTLRWKGKDYPLQKDTELTI